MNKNEITVNQRFSIMPARAALDKRISDSALRTLLILGLFGDRDGWCFPSYATLAKLRGVGKPAIAKHIKELVDLGYLNVYHRYDEQSGAQRTSLLQIRFDYEPEADEADTPPLDAAQIDSAEPKNEGVSLQETGDFPTGNGGFPLKGKRGVSCLRETGGFLLKGNVCINGPINDPINEVVVEAQTQILETGRVDFLTAAASSSPSGEAQSVLTDADFPISPLAQTPETTNAPTSLDAEALYRKLRPTHVTVPGSDPAAFRTLKRYLALYHNNLDRAAEALRPFVEEADRRGIRQTNLCWLTEWAAAGHIPPISQNTGRYKREMARPLNSAPPPAAQPLPRYEYDPNNLPWEWKPRIYDAIDEYIKRVFPDTWRYVLAEEGAEHLLQTVSKRLPADLAVGSTLRVELADGEVVAGPVSEMRYSTLFPQYLTHLVIGGEEVDALDLVYAKDIRGGE